MKIVSIFNNKGGVGKTTYIFHVSHLLADARKTVLISGVATRTAFRGLTPIMVMLLSGCVVGDVRDAETNAVLPDVLVYGVGACSGPGCATSTAAVEYTDSFGYYAFDYYDTGNEVYLVPPSGRDTIALAFIESGYPLTWAYHDPSYQVDFSTGEEYTFVGPTWLTTSSTWTDTDGDGLTDDEEAQLGTDPFNADTDGDALSDLVETRGKNWINLGDLGSDPLRKDLFVECDYMPGFEPRADAIEEVIQAFAHAPVANPDGSTGITPHVEIDDEVAAADADYDLNPWIQDLLSIKADYFNPDRAEYYRYCLWTQRHSSGNSTGIAQVGGDNFVVSLGGLQGDLMSEKGTFMHELGHNLGLRHGGGDTDNYKPNYLSIMSYSFQLRGLRRGGASEVVDFSRFLLEPLNEAALLEPVGLNALDGTSETEIATYETRITTTATGGGAWTSGGAHQNVNWNRSLFGTIQTNPVSAEIDGDPAFSVVSGYDDWANLQYEGSLVGDAPGAGAIGVSGMGAAGSSNAEDTLPPNLEDLEPPTVGRGRVVETASTAEVDTCADLPQAARMPTFASARAARAWRDTHEPSAVRSAAFGGTEQ